MAPSTYSNIYIMGLTRAMFTLTIMLSLLLKTTCGIECYDCTVPPYPATFYEYETRFDVSECPTTDCPEDTEQNCVKITYTDRGDKKITRGCLAHLRASMWFGYIPGDTFTGCRMAAKPRKLLLDEIKGGVDESADVQIGVVERDHRDVEICFCDDQERCNSAPVVGRSPWLLLLAAPFISRLLYTSA